jgi:hypothetical protein
LAITGWISPFNPAIISGYQDKKLPW